MLGSTCMPHIAYKGFDPFECPGHLKTVLFKSPHLHPTEGSGENHFFFFFKFSLEVGSTGMEYMYLG